MLFGAKLDQHPDKLGSVVFDGKMALSVKLNLRKTYKQLDETWNEAAENEHLEEFNKAGYHILIASISDTTIRKHFENNFKNDGHSCSEYLKDYWNAKKNNDRSSAKNAERGDFIR